MKFLQLMMEMEMLSYEITFDLLLYLVYTL